MAEVNLCIKMNKEIYFSNFPNTLETLQNKGSFSFYISFQLNISSCLQDLGQQTQSLYFLLEVSYRNINTSLLFFFFLTHSAEFKGIIHSVKLQCFMSTKWQSLPQTWNIYFKSVTHELQQWWFVPFSW